MSFFSQTENDTLVADYDFTLTPMTVNIIAVQKLYEAPGSSSVTSGNTVWGVGSNLDSALGELFDAWSGQQGLNVSNAPITFTIYDQGGINALDVSNFSLNSSIDMRDTMFFDVGGLTGNIGIAHGTAVEKVVTGGGNDVINGNQADSILEGNAGNYTLNEGEGNDTLIGFNQNDALYGGNGNDSLKGGTGSDTLLLGGFGLSSEADALSNASQAGSDVVFDFGGGDILTLEDLQLQDLTGNITIL